MPVIAPPSPRVLETALGNVAKSNRRKPERSSAEAREHSPVWSPVLIFLIVVLALLPLPFGGWSLWASSLLSLLVGLVLCSVGVLLALGRDSVRMPLKIYVLPLSLYLAVLLWGCVQASSWTPQSLHHPFWQSMRDALQVSSKGAISLDPTATLAVTMELATYGALFWLAMQAATRTKTAHYLARAVVCTATLYSIYGLGAYFTHPDKILWFQKTVFIASVTATFENRNNFATFAGIGTIAGIGLFLNEFAKLSGAEEFASRSSLIKFEYLWKKAWPYFVAVAILATALLLSTSRAGMISTLLGIAVLLLTLRRSRELKAIRFGWLFAGIGILLIAVVSFSGEGTLARFDATKIGEEPRLPAYSVTMDVIRARPWLGSGLGAFEPAFRMSRTSEVEGRFKEAHSDVLENVLELGIPAAVVLDSVILLVFVVCIAGSGNRRRGSLFPCVAAATTVQVGLHACLDFSTQVPAVVVSFVVILAIGFAQSFRTTDVEHTKVEDPKSGARLSRGS
jgi:O-antigen ligase